MELQKEQTSQIVSSRIRRWGMIRTANTELPEDIIKNEILTRLPPESLVRFMLVHKSWKALISSYEFVNSHLIQQQSYKDRDHLITENSIFQYGVQIITNSHSADAHTIQGPSNFGILIGSINGLVCMASYGGKFCIWNPAIGQIKEIYPCCCCCCCQHYNIKHLFGFSWDHKRNDYKVVMVCYNTRTSMKLFIHSSNSPCWTEVVIPNSIESERYILEHYYQQFAAPCTIVKGVPYWECAIYENSILQRIYVFKFVAENNEFRSFPDSVGFQGKDYHFVNMRDHLSVLVVYTTNYHNNLVDMYFLDEKSSKVVWSKMYSIGPIDLHNGYPFCFKNSGDILIDTYGGMYVYDTKTKEWKSVHNHRHRIMGICYSYTPSLVCVQGMQFDAHTIQEGKRMYF